ncbi:major facilitator superfamily domain-containing protein [Talaromyces proteolyticus]|uniref:Major facilitator superfamily domain-containing protein n=1 Tax=Talaromyces proteolyticus TaxID=1131652 RepID=A0AAD4KS54_9EURO|nr:major facilitator superfamily domain-containing protein [Talaromyces proteolyticus]KAH8699155.1 major facilitator superfamily domain-containing protein [Talaromyces proteolyticus]
MLVGAWLLLTVNFGSFLGTPPQLEIFEEIICQKHRQSLGEGVFQNGTVFSDGDICKSEPVQSELAFVTGWKNTLDILPSVALGLPFGVLADKIGRRPITIVSLVATGLSEVWPRLVCWFGWPLRLVWLTGLFRAPGGGDLVATSMLLTVVADVFDADERATALFRLTSLSIIAEITATPISASTMAVSPWIPYIAGSVIMLIGSLSSLFIPETLGVGTARPIMEEADEQEIPESLQPSSQKDTVFQIVVSQAQEFLNSSAFMWQKPSVLVSLLVVFAGSLDKSNLALLIQYASAKFHWTIAQAAYLISLRGAVTLTLYLAIIPLISSLLIHKLRYTALQKDLFIARMAAMAGVIGYFLVFIAPHTAPLIVGIVFMSLSMPFVISVMSVATSFVSAEHVATLFSAMSVSQALGNIVAGPTFAKFYVVGMQFGLRWSGLPFAFGSVLFLMSLIPVLIMRVHNRA